jgi:heptose I phosphotransferase
MDRPVTDRFHAKQGRSTGRLVLDAEGRRLAVYLKRHYRLPRLHGLLTSFWPARGWSPAMKEWRNLKWAREQGVPVPEAVAAAEFLGPWGRLQSVLAVEELPGMIPINEAVPLARTRLDSRTFRIWKRSLVLEVARLSRMLHGRLCFHKDLYLCHFYISAADTSTVPDWHDRVHLIDLHRLSRHRWTWPLWLVKDLAQLMYSSEIHGITARDRLEFWKAYCSSAGNPAMNHWIRRAILFKWRRYRAHNRRRRARAAPENRQEIAA